MTTELDTRVLRLKTELDDHARIARHLGLDFERPIRSLGDGYPENAIAWVGKITERLLKRLWRHHNVPGSPAGRTLKDLITGCRPYIRNRTVIEALHDIQRLRNRSAHDGYEVADEDGLTAVRRLLDVLAWYTATGSGALGERAPRLVPDVAAKAEYLAGLYITLDYRSAKRFELSKHTVYQLFVRERGLRSEYVELLLSRDADDLAKVLEVTDGELLHTRLPKVTRFLILEEEQSDGLPEHLRADRRVVTYDRFMDTFVDLDRYRADVASLDPRSDTATQPVRGEVLTVDERSGQTDIAATGAADELLGQVAADGGNLLILGRPGSGKTTLLKELVIATPDREGRRYRFYFDLSLKGRQEPFADFVTRMLAPYMPVEAAYVFPAFCYFARAGSVLCALDGIDEAVPEVTQAGFMKLFTEIAEVLSAESAVVMTSRVSFLWDSPEVRRLLDGTSLVPEKLVQQLHAQGVDPLRVPRFRALRLRDDGGEDLPLAAQLTRALDREGKSEPTGSGRAIREASAAGNDFPSELLWRYIESAVEPRLLPKAVDFFGAAFLRGVTTFTLIELVNGLDIDAFNGGHIDAESFRPRSLFRFADAAGSTLVFQHAVYQELLAAEFLRSARGRETAVATAPRWRLTEQIREFLYRRSRPGEAADDCVVPAGVYLVGPSHHLLLRQVERPVRLDRFPVTVGRYKQFLETIERKGSGRWDHPDMPAGYTHQPWQERLRIPGYYDDPAYDSHPAVAINWWSAYAYARFEGKRLPTSLEWEAAARGTDGRLFPWGDEVDISAVNCADSWSDHPLITYDAWRAELDRGHLANARPGPVDEHPSNVSPFGIREMAGNVWEFTGTVLGDLNEAVICGGSFDNPYRAVQTSSKGTYRRRGASNAVGFRCAEDPA